MLPVGIKGTKVDVPLKEVVAQALKTKGIEHSMSYFDAFAKQIIKRIRSPN